MNKTRKENHGELPQYYIEHSHEPIIPPDEFDSVQTEIERRANTKRQITCHSPLSMKIKCSHCDGFFGSKVWQSNTKYRRVIWRCNNKYGKSEKCQTPHVTEDAVKDEFIRIFNQVILNREQLLDDCQLIKTTLGDTKALDTKITKVTQELETIELLAMQAIEENKRKATNQEAWAAQHQEQLSQHDKLTKKLADLEQQKQQKFSKATTIELFMQGLKQQKNAITQFDEELWAMAVDWVTVDENSGLSFTLKDGREVK